MRVAVIGQSAFGVDVYKLLRQRGHDVVACFTVPDKKGRPDLLAKQAEEDGVACYKWETWRQADGSVDAQVFETYKKVDAELNVLAFCTQWIPLAVADWPRHGSIVYHPSLLPKHRGASAINWTLIQGDTTAGLTVFWADEGLDTGPILLQRECPVLEDDTLISLYKRFMYPEGVTAMADAVDLIAAGSAPRIPQPTEGASYEAYITTKPELAEINWDQPAQKLHNFIRGNDRVPGAWAIFNGQKIIFYGSTLYKESSLPADAVAVPVEGAPNQRVHVHSQGMLLQGNDAKWVGYMSTQVNVSQLKLPTGDVISASQFTPATLTAPGVLPTQLQ